MQLATTPSYKPLYDQIRDLITQSLMGGEWKPGEMIPSEMDLAARYEVSQGTVRKAIDALAAENILMRKQGKGTFVATHEQAEIQRRFLRLTAESGEAESVQNQLLLCQQAQANQYIASRLDLIEGAPITTIERLMTFAQRPLIYDQVAVSSDVFKGLTEDVVNQNHGSLYRMYESIFGVRMIKAQEQLKAVSADAPVAEKLGVVVGTPILRVERVAYTYGQQPMEWRLGYCLTDNHHYINELE